MIAEYEMQSRLTLAFARYEPDLIRELVEAKLGEIATEDLAAMANMMLQECQERDYHRV